MQWLNVSTDVLHSAEFVGSEPCARATWVCVSLWCAIQENGGRINGAKVWKDRRWQQTCAVTLREVNRASTLLTWEGEDLVVWGYPFDQERVVVAKRAIAQRNGQGGGRPKAEPSSPPSPEPWGTSSEKPTQPAGLDTQKEPTSDTQKEPTSDTQKEPPLVSTGEPKPESVREGNGMEWKHAAHAREVARTLPPSLDTPEFRAAWETWLVYWAETFRRGSPMPNQTADEHLKILVPWGGVRAIAALSNSISRGLRGPAEAFSKKNENHRPNSAADSRRAALSGDYTAAGF